MQTPSHVAFSLFIWRQVPNWKATFSVLFGALLPDITMFLFYAYQKTIGRTESDIWNRLYFLDSWQFVFDVFNSIPIYLILVLVGYWREIPWLYWIAASALLHVVCDFPLHNDDAHRHLLPFSNWRFISPVSYWDPQHYGLIALTIEFAMAISCCIYISVGKHTRSIRVSGLITLSLYIAALVLAFLFWVQMQKTGPS